MVYRIILKPSAERELHRLPLAFAERVERIIDALAEDPHPSGVKKMHGAPDLWRIRAGDYRIVYEIHNRQVIVIVLRIAHRKDVYR